MAFHQRGLNVISRMQDDLVEKRRDTKLRYRSFVAGPVAGLQSNLSSQAMARSSMSMGAMESPASASSTMLGYGVIAGLVVAGVYVLTHS